MEINRHDGVVPQLRAIISLLRRQDTADPELMISILEETILVINGLDKLKDDLFDAWQNASIEAYRYRSEGKKATCPISIGDTVLCAAEDTDDIGNPITELIPWTVRGIAYMDGKWYAIDDQRELNEVGTRYCILTEGGKNEASKNTVTV